jgi:hypothetical protein
VLDKRRKKHRIDIRGIETYVDEEEPSNVGESAPRVTDV